MIADIQCVYFYGDKSICSYDPLKIASKYTTLGKSKKYLKIIFHNIPDVFSSNILNKQRS